MVEDNKIILITRMANNKKEKVLCLPHHQKVGVFQSHSVNFAAQILSLLFPFLCICKKLIQPERIKLFFFSFKLYWGISRLC